MAVIFSNNTGMCAMTSCGIYLLPVLGYETSFFSYRDCVMARVLSTGRFVMNVTVLLRAVKSYRSGACWNIFPRFYFSDCYHRSGGNTLVCRFRHILVLELLRVDELPVPVVLFQHYMQLPVWCGDQLRFSLKRAHIMARVGVCTRPMELFTEPEAAANARLAFMPTSQSAFALLSAAAYRLSYPVPSLRLAIPHGWPRR